MNFWHWYLLSYSCYWNHVELIHVRMTRFVRVRHLAWLNVQIPDAEIIPSWQLPETISYCLTYVLSHLGPLHVLHLWHLLLPLFVYSQTADGSAHASSSAGWPRVRTFCVYNVTIFPGNEIAAKYARKRGKQEKFQCPYRSQRTHGCKTITRYFFPKGSTDQSSTSSRRNGRKNSSVAQVFTWDVVPDFRANKIANILRSTRSHRPTSSLM